MLMAAQWVQNFLNLIYFYNFTKYFLSFHSIEERDYNGINSKIVFFTKVEMQLHKELIPIVRLSEWMNK